MGREIMIENPVRQHCGDNVIGDRARLRSEKSDYRVHCRGDSCPNFWYAPSRLREQISPLLSAKADLTGLANSYLLELPAGRFWSTHPELHRRMFTGDVHGAAYQNASMPPDARPAQRYNLKSQSGFKNQELLSHLSNPKD
jgi:hypothetical protein